MGAVIIGGGNNGCSLKGLEKRRNVESGGTLAGPRPSLWDVS